MKPFRYAIVAALGLVASVAAWQPAEAQQPRFLRVGAGIAGTYPVFAAKLAEMLNKYIPNVRASTVIGGTEANMVKMQRGEVELMQSYTFQSRLMYEGKGALPVRGSDLRALMTTYGSVLYAVASRRTPVRAFADIKNGRYRIWGSTRASVFYPLINASYEANGLTPDVLRQAGAVLDSTDYGQTVQAIQDGRLDVSFFAGPIPYNLLEQIAGNPGFVLLPYPPAAMRRMEELLPGVGHATVPANTYRGQTEAVTVPAVVNQVVISAKLPDDLVYNIAKMMVDHYQEFHPLFAGATEIVPQNAQRNNAIPVHPGAERLFRERGLMR